MTSLLFDVIDRLYPKDREPSKSFYCKQKLLNQLHKSQKFRDMRERHLSVLLFENLWLTLAKNAAIGSVIKGLYLKPFLFFQ